MATMRGCAARCKLVRVPFFVSACCLVPCESPCSTRTHTHTHLLVQARPCLLAAPQELPRKVGAAEVLAVFASSREYCGLNVRGVVGGGLFVAWACA